MSGVLFWVVVLVAVVLFSGDPDLHDKIVASWPAPICSGTTP